MQGKKSGVDQHSPIALRCAAPKQAPAPLEQPPVPASGMPGTVTGAELWGMCAPCNYPNPIHAQAAGPSSDRQRHDGHQGRRGSTPLASSALEGMQPVAMPSAQKLWEDTAVSSCFCLQPPSVCLLPLHHPGSNPASTDASSAAEDRIPVPWRIIMTRHLHISMTHLISSLVPS